jgi:two-component system phosphate regulon response regulator OmpR
MKSVTPRLLIVDDDLRLRDLLERYLAEQGYACRGVGSLAAMRRVLAAEAFDLLVLDLMLPDGDGLEACRQLRAAGEGLPVIMLTAKGDDVDAIVGLELGADDYLGKPCSPRELLARIRAVLRRAPSVPASAPHAGAPVVFGRCRFEPATRQLYRDGVAQKITSGEFGVLAVLLSRPREAMTRERLRQLARGGDSDAFDRSIDVMLSRLRRLTEDDPKHPRYLQTVWGVGYVFVPDDAT